MRPSARLPFHRAAVIAVVALLAALAAGCASNSTGNAKAPPGVSQSRFAALLSDAEKVTAADFAAAGGRTLTQIAKVANGQAKVGLATSVIEPGVNRLAFGVIDDQNRFLYGRSAVYIARSPTSPARGPYPAPADTLVTKPPFRSQTAASESDPIAAIYAAQVPFKHPGKQVALVLTKTPQGTRAALAPITVLTHSAIPHVGQRMPAIPTETVASAGGNEAKIDTRIPKAPELHQHSLTDVLGKQPVTLLIATPQLCQSRVCGPVVDIELQLKAQYGDRMAFIHQEVYVNNEVAKGLRAPLRQLHLQTEPWLFTIKRDGTIAARVEGSFGVNAFTQAVQAALR
jgi:hypothetical protein